MNRSLQRILTIALASATAGACLLTLLPEADASRRASMAQNRLIQDRNDVYLYPQLGVNYANLIVFDYGFSGQGEGLLTLDSGDSGSGLLLLGDEMRAFGVGVSRGDLISSDFFPGELSHTNLGRGQNPLAMFEYPSAYTAVDLFGALNLDTALAGARLAVGSGGNSTKNIENKSTGANQTFVNAVIGYSLLGDLEVDASVLLRFSTAKAQVNDVAIASGTDFLGGLSVRGYSALGETTKLGFLADLGFNNSSSTLLADPDIAESVDITSRLQSFSVAAGAGPVYVIDERATIGTYAIVGYLRTGFDPDTRSAEEAQHDRESASTVVLPGVHVATDVKLLDWLYFRSGVQYTYQLHSYSEEVDRSGIDGAVRDDVVDSERNDGFAWRAGIGLVFGSFTLDGTFQQGFLLNGPDFLSGAGAGLFSMVSMSYNF